MKQQFEIRRILAVKVAVIAILLSIAQLASAQAFDYEKEKATDFTSSMTMDDYSMQRKRTRMQFSI